MSSHVLSQAINAGRHGAVAPPAEFEPETKPAKPVLKMKRTGTSTLFHSKKQPSKVARSGTTDKNQQASCKAQQQKHQQPKPPPANTAPTETHQHKIVQLTGLSSLEAWVSQTERLAATLGCLDALQPHRPSEAAAEAAAGAGTGKKIATEASWLRKQHTNAAYFLVIDRITPALFAYMRVLGYNEAMGRNAADAFAYAQRAAAQIHIPTSGGRGGQQSFKELYDRLLFEWKTAAPENYPRQIRFEMARDWLGMVLVLRARTDDLVRESLDVLMSQEEWARLDAMMNEPKVIGEPRAAGAKRKRSEPCSGSSDDIASAVMKDQNTAKKARVDERLSKDNTHQVTDQEAVPAVMKNGNTAKQASVDERSCDDNTHQVTDQEAVSAVMKDENTAKKAGVDERSSEDTTQVATDTTPAAKSEKSLHRKALALLTIAPRETPSYFDQKNRPASDSGAPSQPDTASFETGLLTPREVKCEPP